MTDIRLYQGFSEQQLDSLRQAYATLDRVLPERLSEFHKLFDQCSIGALHQLAGANIRFVSKLAHNAVLRRANEQAITK